MMIHWSDPPPFLPAFAPSPPKQVAYDTQVFEEQEAIRKQFAELNKVYPAMVRRTKVSSTLGR